MSESQGDAEGKEKAKTRTAELCGGPRATAFAPIKDQVKPAQVTRRFYI